MRPTDPRSEPSREHRHPWSDSDAHDLQKANLGSPVFTEPWEPGAPLDWNEFVQRCQSLTEDIDR